MPDEKQHWTERYVTWQVFSLIISVLIVGIGWAFVATAQTNDRIEKHIQAQQELNDSVIRLVTQQETMQKTLDKIAAKLNVQ